jgi:hypothetical protein
LSQANSQTGWCLPNAKELSSIVKTTNINPKIDTTACPAMKSSFYWMATPVARNSANALSIDFSYGGMSASEARLNSLKVRLVR